MMRCASLTGILPVLCSFVAFILVMLAMFAGGDGPGVFREYDIISVNTSGLGKDLVKKLTSRGLGSKLGPTPTVNSGCSVLGVGKGNICNSAAEGLVESRDIPSIINSAENAIKSAAANAGDQVNNKVNDMIDKIAEKLHIRDFYSLYALQVCEGDFTPGGRRNISECHPYFSGNSSTIPSLLNHTLDVSLGGLDAPIHPSLSDLGLTAALSSALNSLNTTLNAFAVIFSIGVGLTGLSVLCSTAGMFPEFYKNATNNNHSHRNSHCSRAEFLSAWVNLIIAAGAMFSLVLGGLVATIGARVVAGEINSMGNTIGVGAAAGTEWVTLAWAGVGLMAVVVVYWGWKLGTVRRWRKRQKTVEGMHMDTMRGV
ncbi:hypothetical protein BT67DRAFT_435866 [Trichocladium antarcticum]|uniref:Uncharacterized protein n=1 Tax=Trichocladium antarcticum TaxID=1450529 RepID=A0AAN6UG49_9PEZI|nr:hypothetical protein BT67DRAFT_435866 [Trichocladium antarcticum]